MPPKPNFLGLKNLKLKSVFLTLIHTQKIMVSSHQLLAFILNTVKNESFHFLLLNFSLSLNLSRSVCFDWLELCFFFLM